MECCSCNFGKGITIRPDGVHELSPHAFVLAERHTNVDIEILYCPKCGEVSIAWTRTPNTEDGIFEEIKDD